MSSKLLVRFQREAQGVQDRLDKFKVEFDKDPAHALTWANDTFANAAKLRILKQIIVALEDGSADVDNIRNTMMDRILHRSKYPAQSTSPTSNLIEQYELSACADIFSDLQYIN
jgi:Mg-chelatase subunit ChlD